MQRARKGRCEGLAPEKLQNMMAVTEVLALCRDLTGRATDKRKLRVPRSMRARLERESSSRRPSPKNASLLNNGYRPVAVPDRGRNLATMATRPNRNLAASFPLSHDEAVGATCAVPPELAARGPSCTDEREELLLKSLLEWHRWFAWYPVSIATRDGKLHYAWLRFVERKWGTGRYSGTMKWRYRLPTRSRSR